MMVTLASSTALACGGFFCGNLPDPVVQTAERLLSARQRPCSRSACSCAAAGTVATADPRAR